MKYGTPTSRGSERMALRLAGVNYETQIDRSGHRCIRRPCPSPGALAPGATRRARAESLLTKTEAGLLLSSRHLPRCTASSNPATRAVVDLQQHSIFLGSHWAEPAQRAREPKLSSLLVNIHDHAQMDELTQSGIKNLFGATTSQEKLDVRERSQHQRSGDPERADGDVQRRLASRVLTPAQSTLSFLIRDCIQRWGLWLPASTTSRITVSSTRPARRFITRWCRFRQIPRVPTRLRCARWSWRPSIPPARP